ncbi:hypothetical protein J2S74_004744 [Evansella vedderi]|uniref:Uncharacterized protein n=1 Tax=Evansella vedderi TaxID=38282 RepID=A0ABU0A1C0_9BACI|nr:hypothetical protein [Evansella vedderi]MDQ0257286.1 hypothetical protein [Evansella vedderi]
MAFNNDFLMGFVSGAVVGAVGYRIYDQNGGQLNRLIQTQPFNLGNQGNGNQMNGQSPTLEELIAQKEKLEDLIAEKNLDV